MLRTESKNKEWSIPDKLLFSILTSFSIIAQALFGNGTCPVGESQPSTVREPIQKPQQPTLREPVRDAKLLPPEPQGVPSKSQSLLPDQASNGFETGVASTSCWPTCMDEDTSKVRRWTLFSFKHSLVLVDSHRFFPSDFKRYWLFSMLDKWCTQHFSWNYEYCVETFNHRQCVAALYYPDWEGGSNTCQNDGNEPFYMNHNPTKPISWML
jgi:hypothetical protein